MSFHPALLTRVITEDGKRQRRLSEVGLMHTPKKENHENEENEDPDENRAPCLAVNIKKEPEEPNNRTRRRSPAYRTPGLAQKAKAARASPGLRTPTKTTDRKSTDRESTDLESTDPKEETSAAGEARSPFAAMATPRQLEFPESTHKNTPLFDLTTPPISPPEKGGHSPPCKQPRF